MALTGSAFRSVYKTLVTDTSASSVEQVGSIRTELDGSTGTNMYMYVQASGAVASGGVVAMVGSGYQVGQLSTGGGANSGCVKAVGVGVSGGTISSGSFGWIQVRGYHPAILKKSTGTYCTTAYTELIYLSGKVTGPKYANTTVLAASTWMTDAGITALANRGTGSTTVAGFIHCM